MSARRIIKRNAEIIKKRKLVKQLQQTRIFTFQQNDYYQNMCFKAQKVQVYLNTNLKKQVRKMKQLAAFKNIGYLVHSQWDIPTSIFVIHKNIKNSTWYHQQYNKAEDFEVYINPGIVNFNTQLRPHPENCHSFPLMEGIIDRANQIQVSYNTFDQESKEQVIVHTNDTLQGFKAAIFQHCFDHIQGHTFFDPQITKGRLRVTQMQQFFETTNFLLRQYNIRAKDALQKNSCTQPKFLNTKADYITRISKSYRQQLLQAELEASKRSNRVPTRHK